MKINLVIPYKGAKAFSMFLYAEHIRKTYETLGHEVTVRQAPFRKVTGIERIDDMLTRYIFYPFYLIKHRAKRAEGVFHITDHSYTFLIRRLRKSSTVVTCHDLIPLVFRRQVGLLAYVLFYFNVLGLKKAQYIITDSQSSKEDIMKYLGIAERLIKVVYIAYNKEAFVGWEKKKKDLHTESSTTKKFGLIVVGSIFYKNVAMILQAISLLPEAVKKELCLYKVQAFTAEEEEYINKHLSTVEMKVMKRPTDQDIIQMYLESNVLVFTSLYEGFGIPILEAMACDVPVITSRVSSMKEIGGDAVLYADPYDAHDIAKKIKYLYEHPEACQELIKKGREQVKLFTRENCAQENISLYSKLLPHHG